MTGIKRRVLLLAVSGAAFLSLTGGPEAGGEQEYTSPAEEFSIVFHRDWRIRENPVEGIHLSALRPEKAEGESVYERIEVSRLDYAGEDSREFLDRHIAGLESRLPDFVLVSWGIGDHPAFSPELLTYTFTDRFFTLKVRAKAGQWVFRQDDRVYLVTAKATVDSFPEFDEVFREIAASFRPGQGSAAR